MVSNAGEGCEKSEGKRKKKTTTTNIDFRVCACVAET